MNINDDEGKLKRTLTVKTEKYLTSLSNYEIKLIDFGCSKIFTIFCFRRCYFTKTSQKTL